MANKRLLKKDIRNITSLVISDALDVAANIKNKEDREKVLDLIISITETHNDLITRVNHPDGKDNPKLTKKHYHSIVDDLMKGYSEAYEKLGKLAS